MPPTRLGQGRGHRPTCGGMGGRRSWAVNPCGRHSERPTRYAPTRQLPPRGSGIVSIRRVLAGLVSISVCRPGGAVLVRLLHVRRVVLFVPRSCAVLVGHGRDGCAVRTGRTVLTSRCSVRHPGYVFTVVARHRRSRAAGRRRRFRFGARRGNAGAGRGVGCDARCRRVVVARGRDSGVGRRLRLGVDGRLRFRSGTMRTGCRPNGGRGPGDPTARKRGDRRRGQLPGERDACHREPFGRRRF